MDLFNREQLRQLAQHQDDVCISIYMPTFRFESDWSQNPTRFKNLVREARDQLREQGYRDDRIEEILASAHRRLDDASYWRSLSDGLAVFITPESTQFFRLPLKFDEVSIVGQRFHLKPLFPIIATNNRFYLLSLSQNDVRLYQGTHHAISEISSSEIPADIIEAIQQYEDPEESLQYHTQNRVQQADGGRMDAAYHSQGDAEDLSAEPADELKRFFRKVDDGVVERLAEEEAPLVLAGVSEYLPLYAEVNSYPNMIEDEIISGNPEPLSPKELHVEAWSLIEPIFNEAQEQAAAQFEQLYYQDGDLASDDFHEIVPASAFSRVETLFVPIGQYRWGKFDATDNSVQLHDERETGDEDLLDYAAVNAYLNGSTVHALRPENMPGGRSIAATFRFAADVQATEKS
jgi:hypothetical protein